MIQVDKELQDSEDLSYTNVVDCDVVVKHLEKLLRIYPKYPNQNQD